MSPHHESLYLDYDLKGALLFPQMKCVRPNFMNLLHSIDTVTVFATVIHSPKVIPSLTSLYPKLCYILCLPNYSLSVLWYGPHPMSFLFVDIFAFPNGSHAPSENMGRLDVQLFVSFWKWNGIFVHFYSKRRAKILEQANRQRWRGTLRQFLSADLAT